MVCLLLCQLRGETKFTAIEINCDHSYIHKKNNRGKENTFILLL